MPICFVGALVRTLNVQRVRLACGHRAPPRIWTFLSSLRVFPHPARESTFLQQVHKTVDLFINGEWPAVVAAPHIFKGTPLLAQRLRSVSPQHGDHMTDRSDDARALRW